MLEVKDLVVSYGKVKALKGITFTVEAGQVVSLLGTNGAGKTTTLRSISGLLRAESGEILFEGERINKVPAHKIVQLGLAHSPEGRRIFPRLSVEDNLMLGAFARKDTAAIAQDLERVFDLFEILRERRSQPAGTFSGGEQQMLAIGRALMSKPRVLLLDEPSMGLAPLLVDAIFDIIETINKQGMTILLVEQNAQVALSIAHRGYVMQAGEVVLRDSAKNLRENEMVRRLYLGEEGL